MNLLFCIFECRLFLGGRLPKGRMMEPTTSSEIRAASSYLSTVRLPPPGQVKGPVDKACVRFRVNTDGRIRGPVRPATVPRDMFGFMGAATGNMNSRLAIDILD